MTKLYKMNLDTMHDQTYLRGEESIFSISNYIFLYHLQLILLLIL